jgi:hypothetical protein
MPFGSLSLGLGLSSVTVGAGGDVLGPELLTNGDFAGAGPPPTITTFDGDAPVISGGTLTATATADATITWDLGTLPAGTYRLNCDGTSTGGDYGIDVGNVIGGGSAVPIVDQDVVVDGSSALVIIYTIFVNFTCSNISLKEVL